MVLSNSSADYSNNFANPASADALFSVIRPSYLIEYASPRATALSTSNNEVLRGNARSNVLTGKAGNDVIWGQGGNDRLSGGSGFDRIFGNAGNDRLNGNSGSDKLVGGSGADLLTGSSGNDTLVGGASDDELAGGYGQDILTGGIGRDRFIIGQGSTIATAADIITDFTRGEDRLNLTGTLTFDHLAIVQGTGTLTNDSLIQNKGTGAYIAILKGISSSSISIADLSGASIHSPSTDSGTETGTNGTNTGEGVLSVSQSALRVNEDAGSASLIIKRTGGSNGVVTVNYATSNNTATAGQDYTATSGTLTFNPGETSKTITIAIAPDTLFESAEVFKLALSTPGNGATLGSVTSTILTIANDDNPTEAQLQSKASDTITIGNTQLYIGYNQVSTGTTLGNQDPWVASFTNNTLNWYRDNYEITNDDSRGTHLVWDGNEGTLYAAFTSTGTQGASFEDFRRFANNGWLRSYTDYSPGGGGGAKVAILARLNPLNGDITTATFLTALNGTKTNSVSVKGLSIAGNNLVVAADSAYAPRKGDRSAMTPIPNTTATSPNYTIEFTPNLDGVISVSAVAYS